MAAYPSVNTAGTNRTSTPLSHDLLATARQHRAVCANRAWLPPRRQRANGCRLWRLCAGELGIPLANVSLSHQQTSKQTPQAELPRRETRRVPLDVADATVRPIVKAKVIGSLHCCPPFIFVITNSNRRAVLSRQLKVRPVFRPLPVTAPDKAKLAPDFPGAVVVLAFPHRVLARKQS